MISKLIELVPNLIVKENVNMSNYSTFKLGGYARYLVEVKSEIELQAVLRILHEENINYIFLGNGSNTVFRDGVYEGVVIKFKDKTFTNILIDGEYVKVGANVLMSEFASVLKDQSLTGFEELSGIPGTIGGACFMNAGAYDKSISDIIESVHCISHENERDFEKREMGLGYRKSIFMENSFIVTNATFRLQKGNKEEIIKKMNEFKERRNSKQPIKYPSCGSTFKRPEGYFAGKLIEDSNLKGYKIGGVEVSTLHAGFLINTGNGTATDLVNLIEYIKEKVYKDSKVMLEEEIRII